MNDIYTISLRSAFEKEKRNTIQKKIKFLIVIIYLGGLPYPSVSNNLFFQELRVQLISFFSRKLNVFIIFK